MQQYDQINLAVLDRWRAAEFELLAQRDQWWIAMHCCVQEVMNGGFWQYFENSYCDLVMSALDGFAEVSPEAGEIVRSACELVLKDSNWADQSERRNIPDLVDEAELDRLESLGDQLCAMYDEVNAALVKWYLESA